MKSNKYFAPLAIAAALCAIPAASQAALMIQITDGTNVLNVADGAAMDSSLEAGNVSYTGTFGSWTLTAAYGSSATNPLEMHLGAIVNGDRTDGKVWIKVTHTDLTAGADPVSPFWVHGGGATAAGAQASFAAYVDDDNTAFGTGNLVYQSAVAAGPGGSASVALSGTYSATLVAEFDHTGLGHWQSRMSSLDVNMVPEPTSLALLGLGLLGMGAVRRRNA